jgi:predicted nucleotidyltransferase
MSQPINTVVPTLDGPVLVVLARTTKPLTGRKIHQLAAGGSETGTRRVLRRLASTGLVIADQVGASVQYSLNREHLAAQPVLHLTTLRQTLFDRMRDAIDQWPSQPSHVSVFGSTARGDGNLDSDVDLLIVHRTPERPSSWAIQISELAGQVHAWTGNHLQTYEISGSELMQHIIAGEPILSEWQRDSVIIHGLPFAKLRNEIVHKVQQ